MQLALYKGNMRSTIFFLQIGFLYFVTFATVLFSVQASAKQKSLKTSYKTIFVNMGTLSLNLIRFEKMQTYKISIQLLVNSKQAQSEISVQKSFFKELVSNMLYSFSFEELQKKIISDKKQLEDLNIFINEGYIKALKIKIVNE
ncbi:MAG: hypothetical protein HAW63_04375 [Bdellovibrionaceae bacterium]|nr:hypothetical protein [Pseudobdellovibrionaceae bacterium]